MDAEIKSFLFERTLIPETVEDLDHEFLLGAMEIGMSILTSEFDLDPYDSNLTMNEKELLYNNLVVLQNEHYKRVGIELITSTPLKDDPQLSLIFLN